MSGTGHLSELESLRLQVADLQRELAERDRDLDRNPQGQPEQAALLRTIVEGTVADTGEEFFRSLVRNLARALNVRYAFVGEWREQASARVRTLAVWSGTDFLEPFEYDPRNTPCATVIGRQYCQYASGVQSLFPEDHLLVQLEVDSYCGMPLFDKSGKPLGLLVIMDDRPMTRGSLIKDLLQIFGTRAAAELQRQQGDETLRVIERHLVDAQALAHLGSWEWDIDTGKVEWSDEQFRIFGYEPGAIAPTYDTFMALLHPDDRAPVLAAINDALLGCSPCDVQYRIVRQNGEVRFIHGRGEVQRDATGHPFSMAGTILDVTARKQAEEVLRVSEAKFRALVEETTDWMWEVNELGHYTYCSPKIRDFLGYEPGEVLGKTPFDFMPEEEARRVADLFGPIAAARMPFAGIENTNRHKDGRLVVLECRGVPIIDANGVFGGYRGFDQDITDRKRGEVALRQSEERYRSLVDNAPIGIYVNEAGRFAYANREIQRILNATRVEQLIGTPVLERIAPEVHTLVEARIQKVMEGEPASLMDKQYVRLDGTRIDVAVAGIPAYFNGTPVVQVLAIDITERKRAEDALRRNHSLLSAVMDAAVDFIYVKDLAGRYLLTNPALAQFMGVSVEEVLGQDDRALLQPELAAVCMTVDQQVMATGIPVTQEEYGTVGGKTIAFLTTKAPYRDREGRIIGVVGVSRDISEQKRAEDELRKSHTFIRQIIDADPNFIFVKDRAGQFILVNKAVADVYGTTVEHLIGKADADFNANQEEVKSFRQKDLEAMGSLQERVLVEEVITDSTGKIRWLQTVKQPIFDDQGRANMVLGVSTDITDRKQMEESLREREKDLRAAIEERARISQDLHDGILQSLFAVGLGLEVSKSMMSPRSRKTAGPTLDQAIDQLNRVMHEIRSFIAGLGSSRLEGKDLPTALQKMLDSLTQHQATRVRLAIEDRAAQAVSVDQSLHLFLVIQEAVSNCLQHGHAQEATVSLKMLKHGVRLSIRDNGRGFNPEAVAAGHGLGNMAARAQKIGARFTVLSKVNEGTRIVFDLPNEASHGRH